MEPQSVEITSENILPNLYKFFDTFSEVQWTLLAAGIPDNATMTTLLDLCNEVVQVLSAGILRYLVAHLSKNRQLKSQMENNLLQTVNICLGDSLNQSFAVALGAKPVDCVPVRRLSSRFEREIANKVNSNLALLLRTNWTSESALYVSGAMADFASLRHMVYWTRKCLQIYLEHLNTKCLGPCWWSKDTNIESKDVPFITKPQSYEWGPGAKSQIVDFASIAVSKILIKQCDELMDKDDPVLKSATYAAACDIIDVIVEDLHYIDSKAVKFWSQTSISSRPHFNISLILNKVMDFLTAHSSGMELTKTLSEMFQQKSLSEVLSIELQALMLELAGMFQSEDSAFLVSLQPDADRASQQSHYEGDANQLIFPGCIPDSLPLRAKPAPEKVTVIAVRKQTPSHVDFNAIKSDIGNILDELNGMHLSSPLATKELKSIMSNVTIKTFVRKLADQIFDHLMSGPTYQIPLVPIGKSLSDSILSSTRAQTKETLFSPEVLYAMTEDRVKRFLQQMLLLVKPLHNISYVEELRFVLSSINNLFIAILSTPDEHDGSRSPTLSNNVSFRESLFCCEGNLKRYKTPENSKNMTQSDGQSELNDCILGSRSGSVTQKFGRWTSNESLTRTSLQKSDVQELILKHILMWTLTHIAFESKNVIQLDNESIIDRLLRKGQDQIDVPEGALRKICSRGEKLSKAIVKDLVKQHGCLEEQIQIAMSPNPATFDDAILSLLKVHLSRFLVAPKQSKYTRFLSVMGRTLTIPFRKCGDTSEDLITDDSNQNISPSFFH